MHIHNPNVPPPINELRLSKLDKAMERGRYTWEKKYSVVAVYLQCGSLSQTEAETGVPSVTISNWKQTSWWPELVSQIKNAEHSQMNTQLNKIINKALGVVSDRLENGEMVLNNKTGELVRKPVTLRDATRAAAELMNRQVILNKVTVENEIKKQTVEDTLKFLAGEFAKMANSKPITIENGEVEDAAFREVAELPEENLGE